MRRLILTLALLLIASPAWAGWTIRGSNTATGAGAGTTIAASVASVTAGDFVVVACAGNSTPTSLAVSDGTTSLTGATAITTGAQRGQFFYLLETVATGTVTYTCTFGSSSTERSIGIFVFDPTATPVLDQQNSGTAATGTALASGNDTTTIADSVTVAFGYNEANATYTSASIGGTAADAVIGAGYLEAWYRIVSSTFTGEATATIGASSRWMNGLINFGISASTPIRRRAVQQ